MLKKYLNRTVMFLSSVIWYFVLFGIPILLVGRLLGVFHDFPPHFYGLMGLIMATIFIITFFFDIGRPGDF